jgi:hypothetical protein
VNDLSARLHELADDLAGPAPAVSASDAVARYRHRRRTRAGLVAVVAAVAVIAVGVPTVAHSLSSAPARPAAPSSTTSSPATTSTTAAPSPDPDHANPDAIASAQAAAEATAAAAAAAQAAAQPELDALVAELPSSVDLSSPTTWDRWLPGMKPYPGASDEEDMATCPHLADGLSTALGMRMSYWTGTLPQGPVGCTWVDVPLEYDGPYDYQYLISVGFLSDGTTVDQYAQQATNGLPNTPVACPRVPVAGPAGGGVLISCDGMDDRYGAAYTLVVPDARGQGIWVLMASAQHNAPQDSDVALRALVHGVEQNYG